MTKRTVALVVPIQVDGDESLESLQENTRRFIQENGEGYLHEIFPLENFIFLEAGDRVPASGGKNHNYTTRKSEEDGVFIAEVEEFPSLKTHEDTAEGAMKALQDLVAFVEAEIEAETSDNQKPQW